MATITDILATDNITNSRAVINTNFDNLNTDKLEASDITGKQDTLVSGTNIKTINSTSLLGSGDIVISGASPLTTKGDLFTYSTTDDRLPLGTNGQVLTVDTSTATGLKYSTVAGTGDVVGPASATDNAIARFDTTTGKLLQDSLATVSDLGTITSPSYISSTYNSRQAFTTGGGITFNGASTRGLNDSNLNELINFPTTSIASAVNELTISNSATGNGPIIETTGGDTNIDLNINTKGTGVVKINGTAISSGTGDVVGPASAVDSNFASYNTTTGKLIKDSGSKASDFAPALGVNDNYVTDAEKIVIGNTSGTNTGDVTLAGTPDYITIVGQVITRALINLTTHITGILPSANGGTANGFTKFTGPTTAEKTFTLPNASSTLLYDGGALGTPASGTLTNCDGLPEGGLSFTDITTNNASTTKHGLLPKLSNVSTEFLNGTGVFSTPAGGASFWTLCPGTPTRASNTTFTITGDYTTIFAKGMVIKWTESSTVRNAFVSIPSTYGSPNTTITIVGDTMASIDASSLKYAMVGVEQFMQRFAIAGSIGATGTNVANAYYATEPMRVLGADLQVGTANGTSGSTTVDLNKNGTTFMTTKATIAYNVTSSPTPFTADTTTALALGDKVTVDIDGFVTGTAPVDLYVQLYTFPTRLNNLT